jgi:hypothetical protein
MNMIWKGRFPRSGMAQWALFGAVAVVVALVAFVLAALGLVVGALLVGFFSVATVLASRRRRASAYSVHTASDGRGSEGGCVELGKDAYTVRIMDEKNPPGRQ